MPTAPRTHRPHGAARSKRVDYRPTAAQRGYDQRHHDWAKAVKQRDCYLCQRCAKEGRTTVGNIADHIVPKDVAPERAYDVENGQTLCGPCHWVKTHEDGRRYGRLGSIGRAVRVRQKRTV